MIVFAILEKFLNVGSQVQKNRKSNIYQGGEISPAGHTKGIYHNQDTVDFLSQGRQCLPCLFQVGLSLTLFEELNSFGYAALGELLSTFGFVQTTQIKGGTGVLVTGSQARPGCDKFPWCVSPD